MPGRLGEEGGAVLKIVAEWAAGCAYGAILVGMGLVTLMGATVLGLLRLTWWAFCLPTNIGRKA